MPAPRELQSLGIEKFITEYSFFTSKPNLKTAINYLIDKRISNEAGAARRANAARKIFSNPFLLWECLTYVAFQAKKIDAGIIAQAKNLLAALPPLSH